MTQIGLLMPRSAIYSTINFDFVDGLKASLANLGITSVEIKTAGIGVGGSDKEIYTACEKLLFDGAEIIAGYINPVTAEMIQPLFINGGALFIMLDSGYHIPSPKYKQENIFSLSLDGTVACKLIPKLAAQKGDTSFAFTCSYYDAGYRAAFGFFQGVTDAGSEIVFNHVTKLLKKEFTIEPLTGFLKDHAATAIMAACCGDMTVDLFGSMEAEDEYARHHIYASPFVAEEVWLAKAPYPGTPVTAIVPWARSIANTENETFIAALKKRNRIANLFSVLSWEAGRLIAKALESDNTTDRITLLEGYSFKSPRGTIKMDKETHKSHAPLYEAAIAENEADGMCLLVPGHEINAADINEERAKLEHEAATLEGNLTSWLNVYGCLD
jgi:branched-chain amino acid transport system substrate-binding protein